MDNPTKKEKQLRRHKRVRSKVVGTAERPRLSVFKSNKHIYGQIIDDTKGRTLAASSDRELNKKVGIKKQKENLSGKRAIAFEVGKLVARKAKAKKITAVVFDKGGYKYHGRVKAFADGAREEGLKF